MESNIPTSSRSPAAAGTDNKTGIWLALAVAFGLHVLFLLIPLPGPVPDSRPVSVLIELQLTPFDPLPPTEEISVPDLPPLPEPATAHGDPTPESPPLMKTPAQTPIATPRAATLTPIERNPERMNIEKKARLTRSVLSSQFITEESAADQLFGKPVEWYSTAAWKKSLQTEFHFPGKPNLIAMLDQPMQELPFEYTPGLVHFAYEPGVKGDLQRFWDKITPEFGWTTKYGTEVRCIWVLVIAGCAWK